MQLFFRFYSLLAFFVLASFCAAAQPVGTLGTLTVGPYTSSAQGVLTGKYIKGTKLATTISYTNTSTQLQDSLVFTAQVLGNGYAQALEHFAGRAEAVAQYTGRGTFGLGSIELPGPGSYLVQVSAFVYNRTTKQWLSGPTSIYWLFPLADPLPVGLISFSAAAAADSTTLAWETATETNCKHFEVQRSTNGSTWYPRRVVSGQGTTTTRHRYRYTEAQLGLRVYYRLHQVDYDGGESFSPVVVLEAKPVAVSVAKVFPNPARDVATVTAPAGVRVTFYDEAGRERRRQVLDDTNTLDLRGLPAGSYHLIIGEGAKATRTRLTVL